ncbi:uncharacterized protein LOC101169913 isoform X2 [Oryzias latipes]
MCKGLSSLPSSCLEKAKGMRVKLIHLADAHHKHRLHDGKTLQDLETLLNTKRWPAVPLRIGGAQSPGESCCSFSSSGASWGGSCIWPECLLGEVFQAGRTGQRPQGRPRTRWRDYVPQLAWEHRSCCLGRGKSGWVDGVLLQ